ncbi:BCD family chlorophyll transporter-like MFS transporter [Dongia mobilis]|uniref:BCD family chlorophyll transporter-like MFS transporter n=1 Tax=Dongia mobilis TaxID=578943 RepID=A0A4R6WUJ0_9PROT|nr:BCD family MFS transporter [Dongia mobilis]TDQ82946.1 BCD family chlorophyll transporter-like MFS transporter [Dongia mobilis]
MSGEPATFGWLTILRLGLVQTALGAVVVLTTSTLNRVMVVELALPAMVPGALVGLHYAIQLSRPGFGHGSDRSRRRTPWIISGMATLTLGGLGAAIATAWMSSNTSAGLALALTSFVLIGLGVGAAGVSLLALLAARVAPRRRPAAATIVWLMMIAGFVATAGGAGHFLDPFSPLRLVAVVGIVCGLAFLLALAGVIGIERGPVSAGTTTDDATATASSFRAALAQVWDEPKTRRFTLFIFVSMLAFSGQDLILEPFAGMLFGLTPGETTQLAGVQNAGVFLGMVLIALGGSACGVARFGSMTRWTLIGCIASAFTLAGLGAAASAPSGWPLRETVFLLGVANGVFAAAAIACMMDLASAGGPSRAGVRMGLWGAGQAIAFGLGGFLGTVIVDLARATLGDAQHAYAIVFVGEAALFLIAAVLAYGLARDGTEAASGATRGYLAYDGR